MEPPPASQVRLSSAHRSSRKSEDAALVRAALGRRPGAAPAIVNRYASLVRRCLGSSLTGADLDDRVQDVFVRCFEHLPRLRDPGALRSFIIGIAIRSAAMDRRERRSRWRECLTPTGELPERAGHHLDAEGMQLSAHTRKILAQLSTECCVALDLRFVQEKELTEVASSLGVSLATAKRHLARLVARLRVMAQREPVVAEYVRDAFVACAGRDGLSQSARRHMKHAGKKADTPAGE
jgi:RNA polymerase sigma-70 factor (ECF subfamily)